MRTYENRKIDTRIAVGYECDVCGGTSDKPMKNTMKGHHDWGNDSCDSTEYIDTCSKECYKRAIIEFVEEYGNNSNTAFFGDIEIKDILIILEIGRESK